MKKKCKHCFSRLNPKTSVCVVCKIDTAKNKSALTPGEKKTANRCRTLYTIGFLSVVGGLAGLFFLLPTLFFVLRGQENKNFAPPSAFLLYYVVSLLVLFVIFPFFGLALRRYKKWCYLGGIVLYSSLILLHLPGFHVVPIFIGSFFLYWLASSPSREILGPSNTCQTTENGIAPLITNEEAAEKFKTELALFAKEATGQLPPTGTAPGHNG